jgi:hypothetical protein
MMRDAERTQDRQTDRKLGPGVLGAQMETHSSLIASFLYLFFIFVASFLYLYSLRLHSFTIL